MEHTPTDDSFPGPQAGPVDQPQRKYLPWWGSGGGAPATPVAHYWIAALGVLAALILLLNFYQVVRGAVQQGEVQRLAWSQRIPVQPAYTAYTAGMGAARNEVTVARVETARNKVTVARLVRTSTESE